MNLHYENGCLVNNCRSSVSSGQTFYCLPNDARTCHERLNLLGRSDLVNLPMDSLQRYIVCSLHFQEDQSMSVEEKKKDTGFDMNYDLLNDSNDLDKNFGASQVFSLPDNEVVDVNEDKDSVKRPVCYGCLQSFDRLEDIQEHIENGCRMLGFVPKKEKIKQEFKTEIVDSPSGKTAKKQTFKNPKQYKCHQCGKLFANTTGVKNHMSLHSGYRPHKCHICGKDFVQLSCLKTHINTIHSNRKYPCELCGKVYQSEHYLQTHLLIHSGIKNFKCEHCPKSFVDTQALKLHLRTHTKEKPYKCKICSKQFSQQSHLKTHLRMHT